MHIFWLLNQGLRLLNVCNLEQQFGIFGFAITTIIMSCKILKNRRYICILCFSGSFPFFGNLLAAIVYVLCTMVCSFWHFKCISCLPIKKHIISFSKQFQAFVHLVEAKTVTKQKFLEEIFKYTKKTAYIFETQKHSLLHSVNLNYNLLGRKCSRFPTTQSRPQISPPEAYLSYLWQ